MQQARDQQGKPVDWWFIYKTPDHTGTPDNKGFDFLYFDPVGETLVRSPVGLDQDHQALSHTLREIFSTPNSGGFIVYNDEHVDKESNNSDKGHCKGILAFDKASDSALMLLHSTPRFPADKEFDLPWVCVADINRMVSQEKRGGGSLCFQDAKLWQALRDAEEKLHQLAVSQP